MLRGVRALLVDLEGTLFENGRRIPGAAEALARAGLPHVFVTNATSRPRRVLREELAAMGVAVDPERIVTAPRAARAHLIRRGLTRCHFLLRDTLLEDFEGITPVEDGAQAVVLGDLGDGMSYARLNRAFRMLLDGAELVALARNRYWRGRDGFMLDAGAFAAALEHASGKTATLAGKPSPEFFGAALSVLEVPPSEAVMIGDDLEADVGGARAAGLRGVLVKTGKFREGDLERSPVRPDAVLGSLADLPAILL